MSGCEQRDESFTTLCEAKCCGVDARSCHLHKCTPQQRGLSTRIVGRDVESLGLRGLATITPRLPATGRSAEGTCRKTLRPRTFVARLRLLGVASSSWISPTPPAVSPKRKSGCGGESSSGSRRRNLDGETKPNTTSRASCARSLQNSAEGYGRQEPFPPFSERQQPRLHSTRGVGTAGL